MACTNLVEGTVWTTYHAPLLISACSTEQNDITSLPAALQGNLAYQSYITKSYAASALPV